MYIAIKPLNLLIKEWTMMDDSLCKKNYDILTECIRTNGVFTQFSLLDLFMTSACGRDRLSIEKLLLQKNEALTLNVDIKILDNVIKAPFVFNNGSIDYLTAESVSFFKFSWLKYITFYIDALILSNISCTTLCEFLSLMRYNPLVVATDTSTCLFTLDIFTTGGYDDNTFKTSLKNKIALDRYTKSKLSSVELKLNFKHDIKKL